MSDEGVTNSELSRALTRIEAQLGQVTGDHEIRLRRVERWVWIATGMSAAGMLSGVIAAVQTGATP